MSEEELRAALVDAMREATDDGKFGPELFNLGEIKAYRRAKNNCVQIRHNRTGADPLYTVEDVHCADVEWQRSAVRLADWFTDETPLTAELVAGMEPDHTSGFNEYYFRIGPGDVLMICQNIGGGWNVKIGDTFIWHPKTLGALRLLLAALGGGK